MKTSSKFNIQYGNLSNLKTFHLFIVYVLGVRARGGMWKSGDN